MNQKALGGFFVILGSLALLSLILGSVAIPRHFVPRLNLLLAMLYLGAPILAIFRAASATWTKKLALCFLLGGLAAWSGFFVVSRHMPVSLGAGIAVALSQIGIQTFCVGLGALLATSIKDKNLLFPIAIFLAVFDVYLVRTDSGITHQMMVHAPEILKSTAVRIPVASEHRGNGLVDVGAYVGDADIVSLAAFFVALFRFKMRTRTTFMVMLPTLIIYLLVVIATGLQLPALVPIGSVILIVNFREFKLTKDEILGTVLVAGIAVGLLLWALSRPKIAPEPPPGLEPSATSQGVPGSPRTPGPTGPGPLPSPALSDPTGK